MEIKSNRPNPIAESNGKVPFVAYSPPPIEVDPETGDWNLSGIVTLLKRRAILITGVAIAVAVGVGGWALTQKPEYENGFQILAEPVTSNSGSLADLTNSKGNNASREEGLDYRTQIQVLRSPKLIQPVLKQIQGRYATVEYGSLIERLTIVQPKDTKIIQVAYRDLDPQKVKFILDKLAEGYLKYSQQERQSNLRQGVEFVDGQITKTQKRVDVLQRQLQSFRQRNNLLDPENKSTQVSTQLTALEQQNIETQKQLAEAQRSYENLGAQSGALATLAASVPYQRLLAELRTIESKMAIESARFRAGNPAIEALEQQRQNLQPLLQAEARRALGDRLAEVENQLSILNVRQESIANAAAFWQQQAQQLPITARQFTDLQRELGVATGSLNRLLQTRETLQVEAAQKEVPWQLIAPPTQPVIPTSSLSRMLVLGTVAGLLAGIAAALLAERLDNTFHTTEELKKKIKLPLLGVIPFHSSLDNSVAGWRGQMGQSAPNSSKMHFLFSEAFRSLHANLRLLSTAQSLHSIVISSALPEDGKSTIALSLAQAAAAMGQRVLLVDADLRSPQVSHLLGLSRSQGLSDLITTNLRPSQAIQPFPTGDAGSGPRTAGEMPPQERLFVLSAGSTPSDPTMLLSTPKIRDLVEHFQTLFDLVIYDTPPLLSLADSSLLAVHTDGIILVASLDKTPRSDVMDALDSLKVSHTPVLGLVANGNRSQSTAASNRYISAPVPAISPVPQN